MIRRHTTIGRDPRFYQTAFRGMGADIPTACARKEGQPCPAGGYWRSYGRDCVCQSTVRMGADRPTYTTSRTGIKAPSQRKQVVSTKRDGDKCYVFINGQIYCVGYWRGGNCYCRVYPGGARTAAQDIALSGRDDVVIGFTNDRGELTEYVALDVEGKPKEPWISDPRPQCPPPDVPTIMPGELFPIPQNGGGVTMDPRGNNGDPVIDPIPANGNGNGLPPMVKKYWWVAALLLLLR